MGWRKLAEKLDCCEKFRKKARACRDCPLVESLSKKGKKRFTRRFLQRD